MNLSDPAQLLDAWEAASSAPHVARGAVLAECAGLDGALDRPVGEVAALTARLHSALFGAAAAGLLRCGACATDLDCTMPLPQSMPQERDRVVDGLVVRAPSVRDLLAVRTTSDPATALFARCVRDDEGRGVDPGTLDAQSRARAEDAAEELAGAAATVLRTRCPDCGADVSALLDPAELLWQRVAATVPRLLAEVAELAAAYRWSEADILALSVVRRRAYLELARVGAR
ncbi:hypothetical protein [Nocardia amamiensis]|uniref:hypothetical protein n=1 Tax=Nocardia amamiensis TaxID=404578 RepID=UPI0034046BBE